MNHKTLIQLIIILFLSSSIYANIDFTITPTISSDNIVSLINPMTADNTPYRGFLFIPNRIESESTSTSGGDEELILAQNNSINITATKEPFEKKSYSILLMVISGIIFLMGLSMIVFLIVHKKKEKENKPQNIF